MAQEPYSEGVPNVTPQGAPANDYQRIDPVPGAFGALQGQALKQSGAEIDQASQNAAQVALLRQQRYNQISVDGAYNALQEKYQKLTYGDTSVPGDVGIYGLHGKDALDKGPQIAQQIDAARQEIYNGLTNDFQKLQFDDASRRLQSYTLSAVGRHLDTQLENWGAQNAKATITNAGNDTGLTWNSEPTFEAALTRAQQGAARLTQTTGNATDPEISKMNRSLAVNDIVQKRFDAWYANDQTGASNWLLNGKTADGQPIAGLISGESGDRMIQRAKSGQDASYLNGLMGGASVAPSAIGKAITGQEGPGTSVQGAVAGVMPATFRQYAQPGESIGNPSDVAAVRQRIVDDLSRRYNGDPARVAVGFFSGPGNVAPPGSPTPWINDAKDANGKSVSSYVSDIQRRLGGSASPQTVGAAIQSAPQGASGAGVSPAEAAFPDESALVQKIQQDVPDPQRQQKLISGLRERIGTMRLATQTQRDDLVHSLPDLQAKALDGGDIVVPEQQIRHLLPPADAARELETLQIAQSAGQSFKAVQWGTPDSIDAEYSRLSAGLGPGQTRVARGQVVGPDLSTVAPAAPDEDQGSSEQYRLRERIRQAFVAKVQQRNAQLTADPMGYVQGNPLVQQKGAALTAALATKDPDQINAANRDYINQALTVQSALGVPDARQHIVAKAQAQSMAQKMVSADPATSDVGAQLDQMSKAYGNLWPKVMGDLKTLGGLPPAYQVLSMIPDRMQRNDFQNMLKVAADEKGGVAKLHDLAGKPNMQTIEAGIDEAVRPFQRSATVPGIYNNADGVDAVKSGVRNLAAYYAFQGTPDPLGRAADAVINNKYDFDGNLRVPKGQLGPIENFGNNLLSGLSPSDIAPVQGRGYAAAPGPDAAVNERLEADIAAPIEAQRHAATLAEVRQTGKWVTNESDDGAFLVAQDKNGVPYRVRMANGEQVKFSFADARKANVGTALQASDVNPMDVLH